MSPAEAPRAARPTWVVPLLYWLLTLCGLAGMTAARLERPEALLSVWTGTLSGVALGQLLAWCRLRLWLAAFVFLLTLVASAWSGQALGVDFGLHWLAAFAPATLGGYYALSDRGALVAFWYPTSLSMVALLDRPRSAPLDPAAAGLLAGGLALAFVAFLRARETRRVALWRAHAPAPLAGPVASAVLRRPPLRGATQHGWTFALTASALAVTAFVAPHLWHQETTHAAGAHGAPTGGVGGAGATVCCPEAKPDPSPATEHVKEYFPLVHGHDVAPPPPAWPACVVCTGEANGGGAVDVAKAAAPSAEGHGGAGAAQSMASAPGAPSATAPSSKAAPSSPPPAAPSPVAAGPATKPAPTTPFAAAHAQAPHAAPAEAPAAPSPAAAPSAVIVAPPPNVVVALAPAAPENVRRPWTWMVGGALAGIALHLAARAVRRQIALRHLVRPLWPETVSQRVSNLWQLMLVGLRDAGWRALPGEQPRELARRVGFAGAEACALVLERARHGVRIDPADVQTMERGARAVYAEARARAGPLARTAAAVRWPLT